MSIAQSTLPAHLAVDRVERGTADEF